MGILPHWFMLTSLFCWGKELRTAATEQGPCKQYRMLADSKVILGLRTLGEGHWDRGMGTEKLLR